MPNPRLLISLFAPSMLPSRLVCIVLSWCLCLVVDAYDISFSALQDRRVLVVGGSGRVGGSVVTQLVQHGTQVVVGGTSRDNFKLSRDRWMKLFPMYSDQLSQISFAEIDRERPDTVTSFIRSSSQPKAQAVDLIIHTAGPFQGKVNARNGILEACVDSSIPYIDVCDDYCTASAAKTKYASRAREQEVPCIISTGCWPGVSSLMALQLVSKILKQYPNLKPQDLSADFSFFTAG